MPSSFQWHIQLWSRFWRLKKSPDIYCVKIISWCKTNLNRWTESSQNFPKTFHWDGQSKGKVNIEVIEKWNLKTVGANKGRQNFFSGKAKQKKLGAKAKQEKKIKKEKEEKERKKEDKKTCLAFAPTLFCFALPLKKFCLPFAPTVFMFHFSILLQYLFSFHLWSRQFLTKHAQNTKVVFKTPFCSHKRSTHFIQKIFW